VRGLACLHRGWLLCGWGLGRLLLLTMAGGWLLAGSCGCGCPWSVGRRRGWLHSWLLLIALCVWLWLACYIRSQPLGLGC
jgi:hypothetical protein